MFSRMPVAAPIFHGGSVNGLLGCGGCMHRSHQTAFDTPIYRSIPYYRRQTVGGTGGTEMMACPLCFMVNTVNEHRGCILEGASEQLSWRRYRYVSDRSLQSGKTCALDQVMAPISPHFRFDGSRSAVVGEYPAIGNHVVCLRLQSCRGTTMHRVIFQHEAQVGLWLQQVIDTNNSMFENP